LKEITNAGGSAGVSGKDKKDHDSGIASTPSSEAPQQKPMRAIDAILARAK
jgi:hypothetical protein